MLVLGLAGLQELIMLLKLQVSDKTCDNIAALGEPRMHPNYPSGETLSSL